MPVAEDSSRGGGGDPDSVNVFTLGLMAGLAETVWIPAFAGMTERQLERRRNDSPAEFSVNLPMQATNRGMQTEAKQESRSTNPSSLTGEG